MDVTRKYEHAADKAHRRQCIFILETLSDFNGVKRRPERGHCVTSHTFAVSFRSSPLSTAFHYTRNELGWKTRQRPVKKKKKKTKKKWPYRISDLHSTRTHVDCKMTEPLCCLLNNAVQDAHHAIVES